MLNRLGVFLSVVSEMAVCRYLTRLGTIKGTGKKKKQPFLFNKNFSSPILKMGGRPRDRMSITGTVYEWLFGLRLQNPHK